MNQHSIADIARDAAAQATEAPEGRQVHPVLGEGALRHTVVAMTAGSGLPEHDAPGPATLLVLAGRVELRAGGEASQGGIGDLLVIPDQRHSLLALEDASVLLTVVPRALLVPTTTGGSDV